MHPKQYTRRVLAGFMLVVFALSITPRIVLHAWFASHKDTAGTKSHNSPWQFAKATYNCNCENIVAESPFTGSAGIFELSPLPSFSTLQQEHVCSFYSSKYFLFTLRGPPSIVS